MDDTQILLLILISILLISFNNKYPWVFGPIWTTLYIFMSLAIWIVWNKTNDNKIIKIY